MRYDVNGCSTCPPGGEQWEEFEAAWGTRGDRTRVQYVYRTPGGKLFGCIAKSLEDARARRDAWLAKQEAAHV